MVKRLVYMGAPVGGERVCGLWESQQAEPPVAVIIGDFSGCTGAIIAEYQRSGAAHMIGTPQRVLAVHCQCNRGIHVLGAVRKFIRECSKEGHVRLVIIGSYSREIELEAQRIWREHFSRDPNALTVMHGGGQLAREGVPDNTPRAVGLDIASGQILQRIIAHRGEDQDHVIISGERYNHDMFDDVTHDSEIEHSELDALLGVNSQVGTRSAAAFLPVRQHHRQPKRTVIWARTEIKILNEYLQSFHTRIFERQSDIMAGRQTRGVELLRIGVGLANEYLARLTGWHGKQVARQKLFATIELCRAVLADLNNDDTNTDVISARYDLDTRYPEWNSGFLTHKCENFASQVFEWLKSF